MEDQEDHSETLEPERERERKRVCVWCVCVIVVHVLTINVSTYNTVHKGLPVLHDCVYMTKIAMVLSLKCMGKGYRYAWEL